MNDYQTQSKHKYCKTCAKPIHPQAEICPNCGVRQELPPAQLAHQSPAHSQVVNVHVGHPRSKRWHPVVAFLLSFLLPGLGQLYKGQAFNGFVWFVVTIIGYACLIVPGLILHLCCVIGAAMGDPYR